MAISWSPWETVGQNGMRVGIDVSWSTVTSSSSKAVATFKVYTQNLRAYSDNQTLTFGGNVSSSSIGYRNTGGNTPSPNPAVLRATRTYTYTYPASSYGTAPNVKATLSARVSGAYNGVTPSRLVSSRVPARPAAGPTAPTGFAASRVNDTSAELTWRRTATSTRPYSSLTIQQGEWDGVAWTGYATVATVNGSSTNYRRTGLSANNVYRWRVRANNAHGSSPWVSLGTGLNTTPAAPTNVRGKMTTGSSVRLTWSNDVYHSSTPPFSRTFIIERSLNGEPFVQVAASAQSPWTDSNPGLGSNQYRVRSLSQYGLALMSEWTTSNTVSTITQPLAPTELSPNGTVSDLWFGSTLFSWQHNDGGDGADQTRFQIETSSDGATWTLLTENIQEASNYTLPAGILANNQDYLWRVRTQGIESVGWGPWSASASLRARTRPRATIVTPGEVTDAGAILMTWNYSQPVSPGGAESSPQAEWEAELYDFNGTPVETRHDYGTGNSVAFEWKLYDQETYRVRVRVRSTDGLWSPWVERSTLVQFPQPAPVETEVEWDPCQGTISLKMQATPPNFATPLWDDKIEEWPGLTVAPELTPDGQPSWLSKPTLMSRTSPTRVPVDPTKRYRQTVWARETASTGSRLYFGFTPYDADGIYIGTKNWFAAASGFKTTPLAAPLNPGDTTVTLTNATGWGVGTYNFVAAWNYRDASGAIWPEDTYTQWVSMRITAVSGNVVTLESPWTGPALPTGHPMGETRASSGAQYATALNATVPGAWTKYESDVITGGTGVNTSLPPGTASVAMIALLNYNGSPADSQVEFGGVEFGMLPDRVQDFTVAATVERRIEGEDTWVILAEELPLPNTLVDRVPVVAGGNVYRITSVSMLPAYDRNPNFTVWTPSGQIDGENPVDYVDEGQFIFVNYGLAWDHQVRLNGNPKVTSTTGSAKSAHAFLGRTKPYGQFGRNQSHTLSVAGNAYTRPIDGCLEEDECRFSSSRKEWEDFGRQSRLVCYRDFHGHRVFGMVDDIKQDHLLRGQMIDIDFAVTELDYQEKYGLPITDGGDVIEDFHLRLHPQYDHLAENWGLSVNDNKDGTATAVSSSIIVNDDGTWTAEETEV